MPQDKAPIVIGLGELLWDLMPEGKVLGGAPSNFAYNANCLGNRSRVVSAVGSDDLGEQARRQLTGLGVCADFVQTRPEPTGTVHVTLDHRGTPTFSITEDVAWDRIRWTEDLGMLAAKADAVCFGSLAQRSAESRTTIHRFLRATRTGAALVFDVNLRPPFYTGEVLVESLEAARVVKLNEDELSEISSMISDDPGSTEKRARNLLDRYGLDLVCVTRGSEGCFLAGPESEYSHPGFEVEVEDTVGSGDAFLAGMVHFYLRNAPLPLIAEAGNRMGAWVATQPGAMSPGTVREARAIARELEDRL